MSAKVKKEQPAALKSFAKGQFKRNLMLWILVISSALMLSIPFLVPHTGLVMLFAFIPLFAAEYIAAESQKRHFWIYYYVCFLIWNLCTTYWIYNATLPGMIAAVVLNALQMAVIFRLFRWVKGLASGFLPYLFFIVAWIAWEHAYFNWEVSWPWLVLGNGFATSIKSIQWYEYTGTLGGSLWVLLTNALIFRIMIGKIKGGRMMLSSISAVCVALLPIIVSHIIFYTYSQPYFEPSSGSGSRQFTVLQPNIDPYTDKFSGMTQLQQNNLLIGLAKNALQESCREKVENGGAIAEGSPTPSQFLVAPETFISRSPLIVENMPSQNRSFNTFRSFIDEQNSIPGRNLNMIIGAVTDKFHYNHPYSDTNGKPMPPTPTARYLKSGNLWYDRANSAIFLSSDGEYEFYTKSKLVVLVETIPYKKLFNLMSRFEIDLGGSMGSFATQQEREIFVAPDSVKVGTAICYESVYGDYYREYVLNGAQVMSIITNDGWWGDTPGYRQHLSYASLRAIETRRSIARSANTGISAFINQRGEVIASTEWWKPASLTESLPLNNELTIFVRHGDIIGRVAQFLFVLLVLMSLARTLGRRGAIS